jgi:hypothetical protein
VFFGGRPAALPRTQKKRTKRSKKAKNASLSEIQVSEQELSGKTDDSLAYGGLNCHGLG